MNKNQTSGRVKELAGKVPELAGKITGNPSQKVKGVAKQISVQAEEILGDAK